MNQDFTIESKTVLECLGFACHAFSNSTQVKTDFGDKERKPLKYVTDMVEGKVAEFAIKKFFCQQYCINVHVDMEHYYNVHDTDSGNDLKKIEIDNVLYQCSFKVDVKGSKHNSQWLLVERSKWDLYKSDAYIMVSVKLPKVSADTLAYGEKFDFEIMKTNPSYMPTHIEKLEDRLKREWANWIKTRVLGFTLRDDFYFHGTNTPKYEYKKGERLVKPALIKNISSMEQDDLLKEFAKLKNNPESLMGTENKDELKALSNYGYLIEWIRNSEQDWDCLVARIKKNLKKNSP